MTIQSLETELQESGEEANKVISEWQDNCAAAEAKYSVIEQELSDLKAAKDSQDGLNGNDDKVQTLSNDMAELLAQKEEELQRLHQEVESSSNSIEKLKGML